MSTIPKTEPGTLGGGVFHSSSLSLIKEVDVDKIKRSLADLSGKISDMLQDIKAVGNFRLKEVELSVQIGTAKAKAEGSISLKFSAE